jgi:hypothetical protein
MRVASLLVAVVLGVAVTGCSLVDAGLEQVAGAAEISLQKPGSIDGLPLLPNIEGADPTVQDQPPGISTVIAAYGRNDIPLLTLQAYAGAPAAVSVVETAYEKTIDGDKQGESVCKQQTGQTATCWRAQDNLLVSVSTIDGRSLTDLAAVVDEAWTSVRG